MKTIKEIYNKKVITITETASVKEAFQKMICGSLNGLVVVDEEGKLTGLLSIQDIAGATVPKQFQADPSMAEALYKKGMFEERCKDIEDIPVSDIMRKDFLTADEDTHMMTVAADFLKSDLYMVPVVVDDKLMGIITRSELKNVMAEVMGLHEC